jgi:hypothetical protein
LCLGEGAFSKVYLAESKSDKGGLAAVKVPLQIVVAQLVVRIRSVDDPEC